MSDTVYGAAARAAALAAGDPDWMHVTKWPISRAVSAQYRVQCPTCGAKPTQPCRARTTFRVTDTHAARITASTGSQRSD